MYSLLELIKEPGRNLTESFPIGIILAGPPESVIQGTGPGVSNVSEVSLIDIPSFSDETREIRNHLSVKKYVPANESDEESSDCSSLSRLEECSDQFAACLFETSFRKDDTAFPFQDPESTHMGETGDSHLNGRSGDGNFAHFVSGNLITSGEKLDRMIACSPNDEASEMLKEELAVMGEKAIDLVWKYGVRMAIQDSGNPYISFHLDDGKHIQGIFDENLCGFYDPGEKVMVVKEELLSDKHHSVSRHEYAHAYDAAYTKLNNLEFPLSQMCWYQCACKRSGLVTEYAGTNHREYFAESVESYFNSGSRRKLFYRDTLLYAFLNRLFGS